MVLPARLTLDSDLGETLTLTEADWPAAVYGVRAFHGRAIGAPLLVEAAGILGGDTRGFEKLRGILPPVGAGRPLAGAERSSRDGFEALSHGSFSHLDPLTAADDPGSKGAEWYDALVGFMLRNTPPGGVSVP